MKVYRQLARLVSSYNNADAAGSPWVNRHKDRILKIVKDGPSGSGIDCGTKILLDKCTGEKLVFYVEFHHMNEIGMYDGWTDHHITVTPSLSFDYQLDIVGDARDDIHDYLHSVYDCWLSEELPQGS